MAGYTTHAAGMRPDTTTEETMDRARRHAYHGASAAPLYRHVALRLETAIRDGHIVPGGELGNEILLAARFEVSRATMRRAILELVDKGLLVRRRGVGTHVVGALSPGKPALHLRRLRFAYQRPLAIM